MNLYNIYTEGTLVKAERDKLDSDEFGLPKTREYPLVDEEHTKKAIQLFKHCKESNRKELANNIYSKCQEYGINISPSSLFVNYLPKTFQKSIKKSKEKLSESTSMSLFLLEYNTLPINKKTISEYECNCPYLKTVDLDKKDGLLLVDKNNNVSSYFITDKKGWLTDINIDYKEDKGTILDEVLKSESLSHITNIRIEKDNLNKNIFNVIKNNGYSLYNETEEFFFFDKNNNDDMVENPFIEDDKKKKPRKTRLSDFDKFTLNEKNFDKWKDKLDDDVQRIDLKNHEGFIYGIEDELYAYVIVETKKKLDNSKWIKYVYVDEGLRNIELGKQLLETAIYELNAYNISIPREYNKFIHYCEKFGFKISNVTDFDVDLTLKDSKVLIEKNKKKKEED